MTLSADQIINVFQSNGDPEGRKVDYSTAGTEVFKNGFAGLNAAGNLEMFTSEDGDTTTLDGNRLVGITMDHVAVQDSAGDATCQVLTEGTIQYPLSGAVLADVGAPVFISADDTLTKVATNQFFGWIENFVSSGIVTVRFDHRQGQSHPLMVRTSAVVETDAANVAMLVHHTENHNGLLILWAGAIIVETMGGDSEDQGVITMQDTDGTTLGITFTPSDAGADAANDIIAAAANSIAIGGATGSAMVPVPADLGVQAKVTQLTSGASEQGSMKIVMIAIPIA